MNRSIHKVEEGNLKKAVMGKFYITLISLCGLLLSTHVAWAQCPEKSQIQSELSSEETFDRNEGIISFSISAQLTFQRESYRIRLWEEGSQRYVFDDNAPPFLNVPELSVSGQTLSFTQLPQGKYFLELHGGDCQYQRFAAPNPTKVQSK